MDKLEKENGRDDENVVKFRLETDDDEALQNSSLKATLEEMEKRLAEQAENLARELATESIPDLYEREMRREKIDSFVKVIDEGSKSHESSSAGKFDEVELLYWEAGGEDSSGIDDGLDYFTADQVDMLAFHGDRPISGNAAKGNLNDAAERKNKNKYEFQWSENDDALMGEGEQSEEELRLQAMYSKSYSSGAGSTGVTFGLDDIYENDYGKQRNKGGTQGGGRGGGDGGGNMKRDKEVLKKETKSETWRQIHQRGGRAAAFLAQQQELEKRKKESFDEERAKMYNSLDPE